MTNTDSPDQAKRFLDDLTARKILLALSSPERKVDLHLCVFGNSIQEFLSWHVFVASVPLVDEISSIMTQQHSEQFHSFLSSQQADVCSRDKKHFQRFIRLADLPVIHTDGLGEGLKLKGGFEYRTLCTKSYQTFVNLMKPICCFVKYSSGG